MCVWYLIHRVVTWLWASWWCGAATWSEMMWPKDWKNLLPEQEPSLFSFLPKGARHILEVGYQVLWWQYQWEERSLWCIAENNSDGKLVEKLFFSCFVFYVPMSKKNPWACRKQNNCKTVFLWIHKWANPQTKEIHEKLSLPCTIKNSLLSFWRR